MDININFLSEKEVTNIFGVTTNTVAKWRMANNKGPKLPFIKLGRSIAYRREAVSQWLLDHEHTTTQEAKKGK